MLQNMFTKICSESHTGKCDEYDELSKLFKNIGLNTNDIKTIKTKLFKVLDKINARITQSERVKAMKAKIKKLIEELNKQQDVEAILNKIKELLGEKGTDGQPLMKDKELQELINDIFTNIESGQDEEGLNRLAGKKRERDTIPPPGALPKTTADQGSQTELQTQNQATGTSENPEPQPPVNDTTDANLIAAALIANMDNQPPPAEPPAPPAEPPPAQPLVNDTTDANLIAAALIANMDNQPQEKPPAPAPPAEPPPAPPVNDTTDANLIAAALIANMDNQPPPAAPTAAPAAPTEAKAVAIKRYNDTINKEIGIDKLTDSKLYKSLVYALDNNNEKIFKDAMDKTHYENLKELRDKYSDIVEKNYPNNKSEMVKEFLTLLEKKIASIINPQPKVSGGQNKSKKTKKSKKQNKETRKKKIVSNLKYNFVMKKETL
jgi:hypothetical protein